MAKPLLSVDMMADIADWALEPDYCRSRVLRDMRLRLGERLTDVAEIEGVMAFFRENLPDGCGCNGTPVRRFREWQKRQWPSAVT
jgi:hypothetical protein